jgi:hypothetical protein
MTEAERRALGQSRRLVFQNIANGVPTEQVRLAMKLSDLELDQALNFVRRKITEHLVLRRQAPIACHDVRAMRFNRRALLGVLARIGDLDLSTELLLARVTVQALDHPEMIQGAQHRMSKAYGQ